MNNPADQPLWEDFVTFHRLAVTVGDVDPVYPVLAELVRDWPAAEQVEAAVIYVAYYDLGSGLAAINARADGASLAHLPTVLPAATERRAHRDRRQLARHLTHLDDLRCEHGTLHHFLRQPVAAAANPQQGWRRLREQLETIHGNGRWASYKTAEVLQKVAGWPVEAPDMGMAGASGPAHGLRMLGITGATHPNELEEAGVALTRALARTGLPGAELSTVETTLCDFHALVEGRYYVGHDIDQMQAQLDRTPSLLTRAAYTARGDVLPAAYLGEIGGWAGPNPARRRVYRDTGVILERDPR